MTKEYTLKDGTKVVVKATNKRVAKKFHREEHFAYTITIEVGDKKFKTAFHDSINNYWKGIGATPAMIDNAVY